MAIREPLRSLMRWRLAGSGRREKPAYRRRKRRAIKRGKSAEKGDCDGEKRISYGRGGSGGGDEEAGGRREEVDRRRLGQQLANAHEGGPTSKRDPKRYGRGGKESPKKEAKEK